MRNQMEFNKKVLIKKKTQTDKVWTPIKNKNKSKKYNIPKSLFYK